MDLNEHSNDKDGGASSTRMHNSFTKQSQNMGNKNVRMFWQEQTLLKKIKNNQRVDSRNNGTIDSSVGCTINFRRWVIRKIKCDFFLIDWDFDKIEKLFIKYQQHNISFTKVKKSTIKSE